MLDAVIVEVKREQKRYQTPKFGDGDELYHICEDEHGFDIERSDNKFIAYVSQEWEREQESFHDEVVMIEEWDSGRSQFHAVDTDDDEMSVLMWMLENRVLNDE